MGSNPGAVKKKKKKKITGRHLGVMTWVWPGPLRVSEVQGRNTCYKGGFFSEDSLLSSSPMSFYLLLISARKRRNKKRAINLVKKIAVEKDTIHPYKYFERTFAIPRRFQQLPEDG